MKINENQWKSSKINEKMHKIKSKIYKKKSEIGRFGDCGRSGVSGEKLMYVAVLITFRIYVNFMLILCWIYINLMLILRWYAVMHAYIRDFLKGNKAKLKIIITFRNRQLLRRAKSRFRATLTLSKKKHSPTLYTRKIATKTHPQKKRAAPQNRPDTPRNPPYPEV